MGVFGALRAEGRGLLWLWLWLLWLLEFLLELLLLSLGVFELSLFFWRTLGGIVAGGFATQGACLCPGPYRVYVVCLYEHG